ncbi:MAG TPA: glycosyltransferase family 9 protein [Bacteroidetes bacterium]|nr:glycosyltransferase family 9 protein [Bacteroidota bacterium]
MKNILIIQTASLGDVILSTPVVEKLHHFYPDAGIDFLLKSGYQEIFRHHPFLHRVLAWDKSDKKYGHLRELIKFVRQNKYDLVINLQRFASSGLITALSGAPVRIGFKKNPLSLFFTQRVAHKIGKSNSGPHETERNLKLIERLTDHSSFPVKIYPSQHDYAKVSQYKTRQYITVAPGSLWFTKQYPEEKWVEFVGSLEKDIVVYFLGSPNELNLCERIIGESGHANNLNLAGKLSFLESAALMRDALMNYVNDSAPMHLASAVNAPVAAIYCSTVPGFGFGPLSEKRFIIQAADPPTCKPCGLHGYNKCPKKHFECAYNINNEQLLKILNDN